MKRALAALLVIASASAFGTGAWISGPARIPDSEIEAFVDSVEANVKVPASRALASPSGATGNYYAFGWYEFTSAPWVLSTAADSIETIGSANEVGGARVMFVTDVGAQADTVWVIGEVLSDSLGVASATDTVVIAFDAADTAGTYYETAETFAGQVTLRRASAATNFRALRPALFACFDNAGQDFTLTDFVIEGRAGANDAGFNVWLRKHQTSGWGYDNAGPFGTGFYPSPLVKIGDVRTAENLVDGRLFRWEQHYIDEAILGGSGEGFVLDMKTTANGAVDDATVTVWYTTP